MLCFGRIDEESGEQWYVGRRHIEDADGTPVVVALALLERQERMVRAALPTGARVVKELGDGLLLWFDDPRAAIDTCLRLQRDFDTVNDAGETDPAVGVGDGNTVNVDDVPLWVRIGVHWGCPRRRGDDIVGPVFVRGITEPVPIVRVLTADESDRTRGRSAL